MRQQRFRGKSRDEAAPSQPWLTTFADLTNLLLAFFVLLFAMSTIDVRKFEKTVLSLQGSFGFLPGGRVMMSLPDDGDSGTQEDDYRGRPDVDGFYQLLDWKQLNEAREKLMQFIKDEGLEASVLVATDSRGIIIRFADSVLFDLGRAELKPNAREILNKMAVILRALPNQIRVEGHTDDLPINTERFPSNWELSTARATTVVKYLIEENSLDPTILSAAGYGEYRPLVPNEGGELNRRLNRRVDVVVLTMSLSEQEPTPGRDVDE